MNLIFSNYFFVQLFADFLIIKKNWSNLIIGFLVHFQKINLDILEYCNRFWRRSSFDFFFLLALQKITLSNTGEYLFIKNLKILQFLRRLYKKPTLIWSFHVIRFFKILYSTQ